jgi:hypothetical protein
MQDASFGNMERFIWGVNRHPNEGVSVGFTSKAHGNSDGRTISKDQIEDLSVKELISEFGVERFAVAVLPWGAGLDIQRLCSCVRKPFAQILRDELRTVVRTKMFGNSLPDHDIGQGADHLGRTPAPLGADQQALPRAFIDQIQDAHASAIVRSRIYEVVAPHMVRVCRPEPHTGAIIEP